MKLLFLTILFLHSLSYAQVEYKKYPEYTAEVKHFSPGQFLGIKSDPKQELGDKENKAKLFLKYLPNSVFQLHAGCGAVLVSNTGYAVTALHCLEGLNVTSPVEKQTLAVDADGKKITTNVSKSNMQGHVYSKWPFNKNRFPNYEELLPIRLMAFGKGYPDIKKSWTGKSSSLLSNLEVIKSHVDDYAIIKLNTVPKNFKCVKPAKENATAGDLTWTVGYPVYTHNNQIYLTTKTLEGLVFKARVFFPKLVALFRRAINEIRDQKTESWYAFETNQYLSPFYVAVGRAYKDYKQLKANFPYPIETDSYQAFDLITDPSKYMVSTSFTKPGFSGGGIFNTNGELLGINSMSPDSLKSSATKFQPMISHVRIDYIQKQVKEKLGEAVYNEVFNCNN